jgi:hypothetical protein
LHSPGWWRRHWVKTRLVAVEVADLVPEGWQRWLDWDEASLELGFASETYAEDLRVETEMMGRDAGRNLGFTRVVARRKRGQLPLS